MFRALIHRLSTAYPQDIHSPKVPISLLPDLLQDLSDLRARLVRLESLQKDTAARVAAEEAALHKLRGQVHGPRGGRPRLVTSAEEVPPGDKDALRSYVGLRAGQRFTHNEE